MKHYIFLLFFFLASQLFTQTIDIHLPYYAGMEYYFCLPRGTSQDTLSTGKLDAHGRTTVNLPADYRGVGRLTIRDYGRIRNIVINGNERFSMNEAAPSDSPKGGELETETVFESSMENSFLLDAFARQKRIIQDYYETASRAENQNQSPYLVLATPEQRLQVLENEYKAFRKEISDSPLYAARLVEILNCLTGTGSSFTVSQEAVLEEQREFIVNRVNLADLYANGFWEQTFEVWVQLTSANDSLLLGDARRIIDRCGNDIPLRREVTQVIIRLFTKYAKDNLLVELGTEYLTMPLNGQLAPQITTNEGSFLPKSCLILFYESDCGSCRYELEALKEKYNLLTDNNIRVISISADVDKGLYEETSGSFPWADKLCDFKGFDGENFRSYGIVGTPTYILTDSGGIVRGRYARMKELFKE